MGGRECNLSLIEWLLLLNAAVTAGRLVMDIRRFRFERRMREGNHSLHQQK
jgi:hypothetical protein